VASSEHQPGPRELLLANAADTDLTKLGEYERVGGYDALRKALATPPADLLDECLASGLRGRGGAGFPMGRKASFLPKPDQTEKPIYLAVNADESEPGTFKDRELMVRRPDLVMEGLAIAAVATGAQKIVMYLRGEFEDPKEVMEEAVESARSSGVYGDLEFDVHAGDGAYICGEETALLESLEGKRGMPRLKPPFPAACGLYGCPTTVNNVETIAVAPTIIRRGAAWFASFGRENNTGTKIYSISGHVNNPCNVEEAMSIPLKELIDRHAGGVRGGWDHLLAIIPGGSSTPCLSKSICDDILMDFDSRREHNTGLGTAAVIVMDKSTDIVEAIARLSHFYRHESCGQCTPCRAGTEKAVQLMSRAAWDESLLGDLSRVMIGASICGLGQAAPNPMLSVIKYFPHELGIEESD